MNGRTRVTAWSRLALATALVLAGGTAFAAEASAKKAAAKLNAADLSRQIDLVIRQQLDTNKVAVSPRSSDAEFLRRAYLDVTGVIPTAEQAKAFLDSTDPDKRAKLVEELLAAPAYGKHMADVWQAMLLPRNSDNRRLQGQPLVEWLEKNFNDNTPWDKFVSDFLTAEGPQDKNGAVTFFLANPTPDKMTDTVAKVFMGLQLQCAQCHNHPFTGWKQNEYWEMAAFFMKVRPDNVNAAARQGNTPGINESGKGRIRLLPEAAKMLPPKFLQGDKPSVSSSEPLRPVLAKWLTSADNPFFARAMANRAWHHFFGRGIVSPVDDMVGANEPSHPELLQLMADQLAANGFDLKYLIRAVCNSEAYQRTSKPTNGNDAEPQLFGAMAVKVLSPEQLYDSLTQVTGRGAAAPGRRAQQQQQAQRNQNNPRAAFVAFFQGDENADPTEYQAGIPQALRLMNSPQMNNAALLAEAVKGGKKPAEVVEHLYLATLSRRPTEAESQKLTGYVAKQGDARQAYGDILWALLNCSEFTTNH